MKILICHAAWLPERKRTLSRLLEQVPDAHVLSSRRREHAAIWARRAWEWVEDQTEPVAVLNDDVTVCPRFAEVVDAMVAAAPERVLSLHTSVPEARTVETPWIRSYWLTGPGYVLHPEHAASLLNYWASIPWSYMTGAGRNEDVVAINWAWQRQEPFWSCVPAIVKHDTTTASTLGYDNHATRSAPVSWEHAPDSDLTSIDFWKRGVESPPFAENPWMKVSYLEAVRRGFAIVSPNGACMACEMCWQQPAIVQTGGLKACGPCLSRGIVAILNNARIS